MKKFITMVLMLAVIMSISPQVSLAVNVNTSEFDNVVFDPATETWYWPLLSQTKIVTSKFAEDRTGWKNNPHFHQGIDIGGTNIEGRAIVYAARDGIVLEAGKGSTFGNYVKIYHGKNKNGKLIITTYMHMYDNSLKVTAGQKVSGGQTELGKVGNTGSSTGPHLHFQVAKATSISVANPSHKTYQQVTANFYNTNPDVMNYIYSAKPIHIHNFKHDVANEKCYCGETLTRQYQTINDTYTVAEATSLKSKPYANYGERLIKLKKGDKVYVKRTFENVYGNVWCEAESGGYRGYVYFGALKGESNLNIDLTSYPTVIKVGTSFGLRGTISSNYDIKKVSGYIKQGNSICQSTVDTPNSKSVNVRSVNLNKKLLFNNLTAGNYSLYIEAVDASGKVVSVNKNFCVYAEKKRVESTLSINLEKYPVKISVGSMYGLRGSITSNYNISKVKGYIYSSNNTKVQETTDTPNSTHMDIRPANLNQKLIFNDLSAGSYIMKVEAVDASGKVVTATKSFTVESPSVEPDISQNQIQTSIRFELESVPSGNLPYGKAFSLKGWFRSDSPIVEASAYMLDSNKNVIMQATASSTTNNYKIQGYKLDNNMKFNELSPGGYYLKYFVRDANGDTATWMSDMFYIVK